MSDILDKLDGLEAHLNSQVIGQPLATAAVARVLRIGESGHSKKGRLKSFMLVLGSTGVGKTKSFKVASRYLWGSEALARINMAEYDSEADVGRLRDDLGEKADMLMKTGGRIILLDEIEKAHRKVGNLALGMEEAELRTSAGVNYDLSPFHVAMTSNLAATELSEAENLPDATIKRIVQAAAMTHFSPEIFGRFTAVVIYRKLKRDAQMMICEQMLREEIAHHESILSADFGHPHRILVGAGVYRRLVNAGFDMKLGARPMRNVVEGNVGEAVVAAKIARRIKQGVNVSTLVLEGDTGIRLEAGEIAAAA